MLQLLFRRNVASEIALARQFFSTNQNSKYGLPQGSFPEGKDFLKRRDLNDLDISFFTVL